MGEKKKSEDEHAWLCTYIENKKGKKKHAKRSFFRGGLFVGVFSFLRGGVFFFIMGVVVGLCYCMSFCGCATSRGVFFFVAFCSFGNHLSEDGFCTTRFFFFFFFLKTWFCISTDRDSTVRIIFFFAKLLE